MAETTSLKVGDRAPDFTLPAASGEMVSLASFRGKADVVLFFYPKDETAVCTKEACTFRDSYEAFQEAGAEVIGISSDSTASHQRFAERNHLPFLLLSDADGQVRVRYGVKKTLGLIPGRTTFLIDRDGIVRSQFSSQFQAARHVSETLGVLQNLQANRPSGTA